MSKMDGLLNEYAEIEFSTRLIHLRVYENCDYELKFPDAFIDLKITQITKIIKSVWQFAWRNENAVKDLNKRLEWLLTTTKDVWEERSKDYKTFYKDPTFRYEPQFFTGAWTAKKRREEANARRQSNEHYMRLVKYAKADYIRAEKLLQLWNDLKAKYDPNGYYN